VLPRTRALATAAAVLVAGASISAAKTPTSAAHGSRNVLTRLPALDLRIAAAINAVRLQHGLPKLRVSRPLHSAADDHSYDMARHGFFSHDSHDGTSPWARLAHFYRFRSAGETLLWSAGDVAATTVVREWLASPEHRPILLAAGFRDLGVSAVHATAASGAFNGDVTLVTADFGARRR
jgi:uncharacterized protein YkwD